MSGKHLGLGEGRAHSPLDQYPVAELQAFLGALRDGGVKFVAPDEFEQRARGHFRTGPLRPPNPPFGLIKFDIHRNIGKCLEIAQALADARIPALFLMLHRHPFNTAFFDVPETWSALRGIRDLGHEIGLHIDPFHLVRAFNDVNVGLEMALSDFRNRDVTVRSATLHGDTSKHIAACGLNARDFFVEEKSRSMWNGSAPQGEDALAGHVGRYSYAELAQLGIEHVVEAVYRYRGEAIAPRPLVYMTDNNRSLQVRNIPSVDGTARVLDAGQRFRIPLAFAPTALEVLREEPFLALFHPQWFW